MPGHIPNSNRKARVRWGTLARAAAGLCLVIFPVELVAQQGSSFDSRQINRLRGENPAWHLQNRLYARQETDVDQATVDDLAGRLEQATDLDTGKRETLTASIAGLRELLDRQEQLRSKTAEWEQSAALAEQNAAQLRAQNEQVSRPDPASLGGMNSIQLDALIAELTARESELAGQLARANEEPAREDRRKSEIAARQAELEQLIAAAPAPVDPASLDELDLSIAAAATSLERQIRLVEQSMLRNELAAIEAESAAQLLIARRDLLGRQHAFASDYLQQAQQELVARRREEARAALENAREEAMEALPLLQAIAGQNAELAEKAQRLVEVTAQAQALLKQREQQLNDLEAHFRTSSVRVAEIGLTDSVGALLREQKSLLPEEGWLGRGSATFPLTVGEVQFELYELRDRRTAAITDDAIIGDALRQMRTLPDDEQERYRQAAETIAQRHREYLEQAILTHMAYRDVLVHLEKIDRRRGEVVNQFRNYINQRILWIRSNKPLYQSLVIDGSDRRLLDARLWLQSLVLLRNDFMGDLLLWLLVAGLVAGLFAVRGRLRKKVDEMGEIAARGSCCQYWPTGRALFLTLFLAMPAPLLALFAGWRMVSAEPLLNGMQETRELVQALGMALLNVGRFLLPASFLRVASREKGLAASHLGWKAAGLMYLRRQLLWAIPLGSLLTFAISLVYHFDITHRNDLIERCLMIVAMVALAFFFSRIFHPQSGPVANAFSRRQSKWITQTSFLWYRILVALPLLFGLFTLIGYYYTSLILVTRASATIVWLLALVLLHGLAARLILVRRRNVLIEQARQRREQARAAAQREEEPALGPEQITAALNQTLSQLDVDENALQGNRLLSLAAVLIAVIGTWLIWVEVLPAVRMIDEYEVWPATQPAAAAEAPAATTRSEAQSSSAGAQQGTAPDTQGLPGAPGAPESTTAEVPVIRAISPPPVIERTTNAIPGAERESRAVTVRDVLLAFIFAVITVVTARNLPSLLEILFLKQLPVDQSVRHAFKALTSYFIVLVGVVLTFRAISIGWTQVQWLATALTFGLAFGLQEIFANFVAGIILLFERPVRIGDVITVDDITGVVSRIRTRATTLVSWDHREYVIPNKEFITGRTLNWTLTNKITRLKIDVGVAYGSDVDRAKQIILEICRENPLVVDDPPSMVTFEGFGDSALNLVLRTFIRDIDSRWPAIDQLHTQINTAFRNAGIEIAFPQRDVHVRSVDATLLPRVGGSERTPKEES